MNGLRTILGSRPAACGTGAARRRSPPSRSPSASRCCSAWSACAPRPRDSFANTISGTDLVVGARTAPLEPAAAIPCSASATPPQRQLEDATRDLRHHPEVAWTVPLSLGDSHRGFRVLGTSRATTSCTTVTPAASPCASPPAGRSRDLFDVVLGAEVARTLGYQLGRFARRRAWRRRRELRERTTTSPSSSAGILTKTGTPVDRTLHVSLEAIKAIHLDWHGGAAVASGLRITAGPGAATWT